MADRTSSSIMIDAPRRAVLDVISDFPAYPQWAGSIKLAEVVEPGADGLASQVHFVLETPVINDDYVLAYDWRGLDGVSWSLVRAKMMKGQEGSYTLLERAGGTEVQYELMVDIGIPMLGLIKRKAERRIIDVALRELKKRVEA